MNYEKSKRNLEGFLFSKGFDTLEMFDEATELSEDIPLFHKMDPKDIYNPSLKSKIDYKSVQSKYTEIENLKKDIDRRIKIESRKRNSLSSKMVYNLYDFLAKVPDSHLENLLDTQEKKISTLSVDLNKFSNSLSKDYQRMESGFKSLCRSWIKTDSLQEEYLDEIKEHKDYMEDNSVFEGNIIKNLKIKHRMNKDIRLLRSKIKTLKSEKSNIESSFETYKLLIEKNQGDRLFISNINDAVEFYRGLLDNSGNVARDYKNFQNKYSLPELKSLSGFYAEKLKLR